jgi:hypothetical protein
VKPQRHAQALDGWFKREKPKRTTTAIESRDTSKGPKLTCKAKPDEDPTWKIGKKDFADDEHIETIRNMPLQSRASADQWLCKEIGFEWNTDAAFTELGDGDLFYCNADGTVEGVSAYERRTAEQRESEKIQRSVANATDSTEMSRESVANATEPQPDANAPKPPEPESPDDIAHEQFMASIAAEEAAAGPQHGDIREDGRVHEARGGLWLKKNNWDNLERARKL